MNLPTETKKQLQNLYSWKQFYTVLGTPNSRKAKIAQDQINQIVLTHNKNQHAS